MIQKTFTLGATYAQYVRATSFDVLSGVLSVTDEGLVLVAPSGSWIHFNPALLVESC